MLAMMNSDKDDDDELFCCIETIASSSYHLKPWHLYFE